MSTNFYLLLVLFLVFPSINPISAFAQSPFSVPSLARSGDSLMDREPTWWKWVYTDQKTGVRFASYYEYYKLVIGEVPDSLDLTDDELAKKLLTKGRDIWLYNTDYRDYYMRIEVRFYRSSFVSWEQEKDVFGSFRGDSSDKPLEGFTKFKTKNGDPHYVRGYELTAYSNKVSNKVVEAKRKAEAAAKRELLLEAEAKRKAEAKAKSDGNLLDMLKAETKREAEAAAKRELLLEAEAKRKAEAEAVETKRKAEAEAVEAKRRAEAEVAEAKRRAEAEASEGYLDSGAIDCPLFPNENSYLVKFKVDKGTRCSILDYARQKNTGVPFVKVRIDNGPHTGEIGYVPEKWLKGK